MTAFQKLILFSTKLDAELCTEYQQLISDYMDERDRLQNERLANSIKYDVVAIAGTAEQLLTDVTDTNVGEINVGDTVELQNNLSLDDYDRECFGKDNIVIGERYKVTSRDKAGGSVILKLNHSNHWHFARHFRKVLTDVINVGDTVKCVVEFAIPQDSEVGIIIPCEYTATVQSVYGGCISLPYSENLYKKSDFRKVSTPIVNPIKTVEGC